MPTDRIRAPGPVGRRGGQPTATRRPRRVDAIGEEPDPRFTLANERTLLAWLRTALALVATGIAAVALSELITPEWLVDAIAVVAFGGGGATALLGYRHWQRVERALRLDQPLPSGLGALAVIATILVIATFGVVALLGVVE